MQETVIPQEQAETLSPMDRDMMLIIHTHERVFHEVVDEGRIFAQLRKYFPKYKGDVDPFEMLLGVKSLVERGLVENTAAPNHSFGSFRLTPFGMEVRGLVEDVVPNNASGSLRLNPAWGGALRGLNPSTT